MGRRTVGVVVAVVLLGLLFACRSSSETQRVDEAAAIAKLRELGVEVRLASEVFAERRAARWRSLDRVARAELAPVPSDGWVVTLEPSHTLIGHFQKVDGSIEPRVAAALSRLPKVRGLVLRHTQTHVYPLEFIDGLDEIELLDLGFTPIRDDDLRQLRQFSRLRELDVSGTRVTSDGLIELAHLPQLRTLVLNGHDVTDSQLEAVGKLTQLQELDLTGAQVTNAGFVHLGRLARLEAFHLSGTRVDDRSLWFLRYHPRLKLLGLYGTAITNRGLRWVGELRGLQALDLESCANVDDEGLAHLQSLNELRALSLKRDGFEAATITGEGVKHVSALTQLRSLNLYATQIADDSLVHLKALTRLRELDLSLTNLTDEGMIHLQPLVHLERLVIDYQPGFLGPNLTDGALTHLTALENLQYLSLTGAKVTSAGLSALEKLPRLQSVRREGGTEAAAGGRATSGSGGGHWPCWRGPKRDAIAMDSGLEQSWGREGPALIWSGEGLGVGYATVVVADGRVFTIGKQENDVYIYAISDTTGKQLWKRKIGSTERDAMSTPTVDEGHVYALDPEGHFFCMNTSTGEVNWQYDFVKDFDGRTQSARGYAESPLIDGDKLICTPGGEETAMMAFDKRTGEPIWKSEVPFLGERGRDGASFASAAVTTVNGVRIYVQLMGRGVVGVRADDGTYLFGYNPVANNTANISSPIVHRDFIFASTGYGTGSVLLQIVPGADGAFEAQERYFLNGGQFQNHHGGIVLVGNHVYGGHGSNNGIPTCIELETGKIVWRSRGPGTGSAAIVCAEGHLYFRYQNGVVALIEATPEGYRLKGQFNIPGAGRDSWPHPVIAGGRLYLREQDRLLVYDVTK